MLLQSPSVSKRLLFRLLGIHNVPDHTACLAAQATGRVVKWTWEVEEQPPGRLKG